MGKASIIFVQVADIAKQFFERIYKKGGKHGN